MKRVAILAAIVMAIVLGWISAALVYGEQAEVSPFPDWQKAPIAIPVGPGSQPPEKSPKTVPAAPPKSGKTAPAESVKTPPAAATKAKTPTAESPGPVAKPASEEPLRPLPEFPAAVTPPPPLPEVEIPPIPEVDKDPFKAGPPPVRNARPDIIEEGKRVFNREGRLEIDPLGRAFFVFDSGEKPMRILENSWLQFLEGSTERGKKRAKWRVSGIIMVYEGANYLLITRASRVLPEEENL